MCDQVDNHIDQLEALVARQRQALELIFTAWGRYAFMGADLDELESAIMAAQSASSMTGTSEK